jgi:hypothetical protein
MLKSLTLKSSLTFLILIFSISLFSQDENSESHKRWDLLVGIGAGSKSHFGNFGITSNLYLSKYLSIKASAGTGALNNNGGILSGGLEFDFPIKKSNHILIGSCYTYSGSYYQVLNDELPTEKNVRTLECHYSRSYVGYGLSISEGVGILKFELGYSLPLSTPFFIMNGSGVWTQAEMIKFQKSLDSGLLISLTCQVNLFAKKNRDKSQ